MKNNKKKVCLLILILIPTLFICYRIFITNSKNSSTLNNHYINYENKEYKENTNIPIDNELSNEKFVNEENSFKINEENVSKDNIEKEEYIDEVVNNEVEVIDNKISESNSIKILSIDSYITEVSTKDYKIKKGDTISQILREFESTCNYKTGYKYLKLLNPNIDLNEVEIDTIIKIPYDTFYSGKLYLIKNGDTWYKLIKENYPDYNVDIFSKFLININDLPNSDLPLGENIFLPKI